MWKNPATALSLLTLWLSQTSVVEAVLPTAALDVTLTNGTLVTMLVSQASFGVWPEMTPEKNPQQPLSLAPSNNALLCYNVTSSSSSKYAKSLMLVPRGNCTFEQKALNAQRLGATGLVVYGALASRYSLNTTKYINHTDHVYTTDDIVYPQEYNDYDCNKGKAGIPAEKISMTPLPYNAETNDPLLGDYSSSLCIENSEDSLANCPSKSCLLTGKNVSKGVLEACCAWDLHVWLYDDPAFTDKQVAIPAVYLTMQQGNELVAQLEQGGTVQAVLYARYRPAYNPSALLIWALGVMVCAMAAYLSAGEYHSARKHVERHQVTRSDSSLEAGRRSSSSPQVSYQRAPPPEETLELSVGHAFGFIVMASAGLFILFFFKVCKMRIGENLRIMSVAPS